MRSLLSGVDGFIGSWLARVLLAAGDRVDGLSRRSEGTSADGVTRHLCDITDAESVRRLVERIAPDRVFHLAAVNDVAASFASPQQTSRVNIEGSLNLLEAIREFAQSATLVSVGSSSEYGATAASTEAPLTEDLPLWPSSPYGVSKAAQGMLVRLYAQSFGLHAMHVRPFAIVGPGKIGDALSDFCRDVVAIERGRRSAELRVGNLDSVRDFVDVRDGVRALVLIAEKGLPGEVYNLCNGRGEQLRAVVAIMQEIALRSFVVTEDPGRFRLLDDLCLVGDVRKLTALGYAPEHPLAETVRATLDSWRDPAA